MDGFVIVISVEYNPFECVIVGVSWLVLTKVFNNGMYGKHVNSDSQDQTIEIMWCEVAIAFFLGHFAQVGHGCKVLHINYLLSGDSHHITSVQGGRYCHDKYVNNIYVLC